MLYKLLLGRPYQMNCDEEVDDKGPELCREWARGE